MSDAEIQALRARYDALSRGDRAAAFRDVHPDFELKTVDRVPNAGTYRGSEDATRFLEDLWEPFEEVTLRPEEFFERDDRIVVFLLVHARHKGSDAVIETRIGALWTMQDGKPVRCEMFAQREKALKAAGTRLPRASIEE
jgi:ketosteroid isomerase-like protein